MARAHGIYVSTTSGDEVRHYHDAGPEGHAWLNIGNAVDIFMPHNADEALEFLNKLQTACEELYGKIMASQPGAGK